MPTASHQVDASLSACIRLIHRFLSDTGLHTSAACLQRESLVRCRHFSDAERAEFRDAVVKGEWDVALRYVEEGLFSDAALFSVWEAIVLDFSRGGVESRATILPGLDSATAMQYATDLLKHHPILQRMQMVEAARYARLAAAVNTTAHHHDSGGVTWRHDAWSALEAELVAPTDAPSMQEEQRDVLTSDQWASLLLVAAAPEVRDTAATKSGRSPSCNGEEEDAAEERRLLHLATRQEEALLRSELSLRETPFSGTLRDTTRVAAIARPSCAALTEGQLVIGSETGAVAICSGVSPVTYLRAWTASAGVLSLATARLGGANHAVVGLRDGSLVCLRLADATVAWSSPAIHSMGVSGVAVVDDRDRVVTASFDARLKVVALSTGRVLKMLSGHASFVHSVCAYATETGVVFAASASSDGTVRLWNCSDGSEASVMSSHPWGPNAALIRVRRHPSRRSFICLRADGAFAELDDDLRPLATVVPPERTALRDAAELLLHRNGDVAVFSSTTRCAYYSARGEGARHQGPWAPTWELTLLEGAGAAKSSQGLAVATDDIGRVIIATPGQVSIFT